MSKRDVIKPCKSHKWEALAGQKDRYECSRCGAHGYGKGAGITVYAMGTRFWERQQKQQQSGRHGT